MYTYYSIPLINVFSETSIQKKRLHTSVKNVVLIFSYEDRTDFSEECGTFSVMKTEPTSVNNMVLFLVMDTDYPTPLITVSLWYPFTLYMV